MDKLRGAPVSILHLVSSPDPLDLAGLQIGALGEGKCGHRFGCRLLWNSTGSGCRRSTCQEVVPVSDPRLTVSDGIPALDKGIFDQAGLGLLILQSDQLAEQFVKGESVQVGGRGQGAHSDRLLLNVL